MPNHGQCSLKLLYRLNGCGMWLTVISLVSGLVWLWLHEMFETLTPASAPLIEIVLTRIVGTTLLVYAASWLLKAFRKQRLEAKNSQNSGC